MIWMLDPHLNHLSAHFYAMNGDHIWISHAMNEVNIGINSLLVCVVLA